MCRGEFRITEIDMESPIRRVWRFLLVTLEIDGSRSRVLCHTYREAWNHAFLFGFIPTWDCVHPDHYQD